MGDDFMSSTMNLLNRHASSHDGGMGDWMRVGDDHVEAQTGGMFEVWAQEIGGHDVNGNVGS